MNMEVQKISVDKIIPNRFQPRKNFEEDSLEELADSIRQHGIIQPLVLRKLGENYEIIAGERRYKAALKLSMKEVPAIIMELDDTSSAEIALVENIQRKDLTAIEEAKSYEKILELGQINQDELAKRVGKKQSTVSNKLRLLNLSDEAQQALLDGKISERHARSLLRLKDKNKQNEMLNKIIKDRMTVRETDIEIKKVLGEDKSDLQNIDEIIDFQPDIPIIKEPEIEHVEEVTIPELINENRNENNMNNTNDNLVFINPEIVQSNNDMTKSDEVNYNNINNQIMNIPDYDQIGINQPDSINNLNSQTNNDFQQKNGRNLTGGKFFNLDDEAANMNMGETFNSNNYIDPQQYIPTGTPNFNEHQINPQSNYVQTSETNNYIDPFKQNNINIPPQPMISQQDITGAVAVIRNTIINLQNNGYLIKTNEQDLGSAHQIIIEIKK